MVLEPLGRGGMGEVYRARDERLGREVAIKVLPEAFSNEPERLARFEREAHLLAALNHPNIASIHDFERAGEVSFLVMELVPGETLADMVARGPLEPGAYLRIFQQTAEALEAAHEKGIMHRDLKPANIKVTPEGKVKVLDFGLAKALSPESDPSVDLSHSPTATYGMTGRGALLGTAAYMSPEQARGKPLDRRTDIWSFGCVLYEALTGRKAFEGETVTDVLAAIVKGEPRWERLPSSTPAQVEELLRRCLQKERNQRLRDIGDARLELEEAIRRPAAPTDRRPPTEGRKRLAAIAVITAAIALSLGAALGWLLRSQPRAGVVRFQIHLPKADQLNWTSSRMAALSPDGRLVVYSAVHDGKAQLFRRSLDRFETEALPGTEGALGPFFSPDGRSVGFWSDGSLKKLSLDSGIVSTLGQHPFPVKGVWTASDDILFNSDLRTVSRLPAAGGSPVTALTTEDLGVAAVGNVVLAVSGSLPDGDHLLLTALEKGKSRLLACSLSTKQCQVVLEDGISGQYAPPGFLVYARRDGTLMAVRFDAKRLAAQGRAAPVAQDVIVYELGTLAEFAVSERGSLIYVPGHRQVLQHSLVWVDRSGAVEPALSDRRPFENPCLSPGGRHLAVYTTGEVFRVWVGDLSRDTLTLLDPSPHESYSSSWTPDGRRVTFVSDRAGEYQLFSQPVSGGALPERLVPSEFYQNNPKWSPDGKLLVYSEKHADSGWDVMLVRMNGERKPVAFVQTAADDLAWGGDFSRDGRAFAYTSRESGQSEIYVKEVAEGGERIQVSSGGSEGAVWSRDGRELYYVKPGGSLMAVPIRTSPTLEAGRPYVVFECPPFRAASGFDVAPDGRFLGVEPGIYRERPPVHVVLSWAQELADRATPPK